MWKATVLGLHQGAWGVVDLLIRYFALRGVRGGGMSADAVGFCRV